MFTFARFISRESTFLMVLTVVPALSVLVAVFARKRVRWWIPLVAGAVVIAFYFAALANLSRGTMRSLGESGTDIVLLLLILVIPVVAGIVAAVGYTRHRRGTILANPVSPVRAGIIVAVYIAFIVAIVTASDWTMRGNYAWRSQCMNNVRQVGMACRQYADDHEGRYPASFGVILKEGYLMTGGVFFCPSILTESPANLPIDDASDYALMHGIDGRTDNDIIVVYEKDGAHFGDGRNVFFADGHTQWLPEERFQEILAAHRAKLGESK